MDTTAEFDFIIVGGGMAGVSAAAHIAPLGKTLLLERESAMGTHSTGRSAATFYQNYGASPVRALNRASLPFFMAPPAGFANATLTRPLGSLMLAAPGDEALFDAYLADPDRAASAVFVTAHEACARVPMLYRERIGRAIFEPDALALDVDLLLQGFRRTARAAGAEFRVDAEVTSITRDSGWCVRTSGGAARAPVLVNAAGAWADELAAMAGVPPLGLAPKRRTAFTVAAPQGVDVRGWPMVVGVREDFYFKPDAGAILMSLADEADSPPCDAWPRDEDIALAVDRIQQVANIPVDRIVSRWAGLRSFMPDRVPCVGFDPLAGGFFWLAGQGGYGIQTAPALARLAAALASGRATPTDIADCGLDVHSLSPARFRRSS